MCKQALQLQKDCSSSLHLRALECHCHFSPNSQIHALKSHTIFSTFPKLSHLTAVCLCHHAPLKVQQKYNKQCFIEVNYLLTTSTIQQYVRTDLTKSSWRIIQYKIQIPVQGSFQSPYIASDSEIQYFSLQQPSVRQSFKHASFFQLKFQILCNILSLTSYVLPREGHILKYIFFLMVYQHLQSPPECFCFVAILQEITGLHYST